MSEAHSVVDTSHTSRQPPNDPSSTRSSRAPAKNLFFPLITITVGLFIITIFSLVATMFGNPQAPVALFFTQFGGWMLGIEVMAFMIVGLLALIVDRRQSLRDWEAYEQRQLAKRPPADEVIQPGPNAQPQSPAPPPTDTP